MTTEELSKVDPDLGFLAEVNNEDLCVLVDYIVKNKDGNPRFTEELTEKDKYKECYPDSIQEMLPEVVQELQRFGGNSIVNFFRQKGVPYKELLTDVCRKMKVSFASEASVEDREQALLLKMFDDSVAGLSEEELAKLMEQMNLPTQAFGKQAMLAALQLAIKNSGFMFYKMSVIVANQVARAMLGRGLTLAANAGITRGLSLFAGPIGWAVTLAWTAVDIASPAYRVTIPATVHIAYLRTLHKQTELQDVEAAG
ncbi:DUF3944 domain-containing protein [Porphyromonas somerae]|uniref:DUF3944 domain-containing protein n=1 Tax=Porphyromonas somerae TaxID=322095 RepID=A0A134BEM4_9PORP|nr:DUF3944 domain-containing protein [Porphyromonas somerae]KXB77073.1 hypothetical protein HMPREF3184_00198 [Porphyromonadaceae bacterium KA00676]KXB78320.1 hypothetical protein HMPREF3185_00198 [Porphyromonas somerae]